MKYVFHTPWPGAIVAVGFPAGAGEEGYGRACPDEGMGARRRRPDESFKRNGPSAAMYNDVFDGRRFPGIGRVAL